MKKKIVKIEERKIANVLNLQIDYDYI
jgi:hypothetical protein